MHDGIRSLKWGLTGMAAVYIVLGVILVIWPESSARTMCDLVGAGIFIAGAICFITFFARSARIGQARNRFVVGLVLMLIGLFIAVKADLVVAAIPFLLGIMVTLSGIRKVQDALTLKRVGADSFKTMMIIGILNLIFGVILIFNAGEAAKVMFILIGVGLIFSGITDLFSTFYVSSKLD